MIASRERQHGERVPILEKYDTKILPISSIYGGNASGKSNFVKALETAKQIITTNAGPDALLPYTPYKLSNEKINEPTKFSFVLLANRILYEYSFSFTKHEIIKERLIEIATNSEIELFSRNRNYFTLNEKADNKTSDSDQNKNRKFIEYALEKTSANQLFITRLFLLNFDLFNQIYNRFNEQLVLITPDTFFSPIEKFIDEENPLYLKMAERISDLDTGIEHLGGEDVPLSNIKENLQKALQENLSEGVTVRISNSPIIATKKNGEIELKKLVAYHLKEDDTESAFDFYDESDGSQRVTDLLPAFFDLENQSKNKVYVIDELDRSMHTFMARKLLEFFLESVTKTSRSQLIFTTHDVMLMDQKLLRRDEMRIVERTSNGATKMYAISDYQGVRYDKDIRKSYLQGRFGGIPKIFLRTIN